MRRKYYITFFFTCFTLFFFSQYQVRNFFNLTGKKDIPVNVITQDHSGFLWLGTKVGVFRFDGKQADNPYLHFNQIQKEITALFVDNQDKLWVGLKSGQVYCLNKNRLDSVIFPNDKNTSKVTSFYQYNNQIYIGTYGNGVFHIKGNIVDHISQNNGLSDDVIYTITGNNLGKLWFATDAGISELDIKSSSQKIKIISNTLGLPDNIVRDIYYFNNKLCISMQDSGVCYYNLSNQNFERKTFFSDWSLGPVVNAYSEGTNNTILATESKGLLIIKNSRLNVFDYSSYIQTQSIHHAFIDREKQIWLASKKGISQIVEKRHQLIGKVEGLRNENILAVAIDKDQSIWLGSTSGVSKIMLNDKGDLMVKPISALDNFNISCATVAPDGDIWFGTYGQGIIVLNTKTGNYVILNTNDDQISDNNISHLYFENNHHLYISTLGGGLIKTQIDLEGEYKLFNIEKVFTDQTGLGSNYLYSSITDTAGVLYTATDGGGLQKLEQGKFIDLTKKHGFNSNTVFSLCRDLKNNIWAISNAEGILKYDGKILQKIGFKEGLRDLQPQQIVSAEKYLYSIHAKGIDRINIESNAVSYFDINAEGLDPNLNAVIHFQNNLYSGTTRGLIMLRTSKESTDSIAPKIFMRMVELNYKPINFDSASIFKYNQNTFGFTFDGIWMKNPGKLKFRHKLQGFENEWILSEEGKRVMYNNLDPGYYIFIAQSQNEEEMWSEPLTYSFMIETPIWKRWWFWLISLGGFAASIFTFIRYRLRALQKENILLELKVKERTAEIEEQSRIIELKNIELEQLSLVASKTDNVVLILDAEGELEYINESFIKLHGLTKDELIQTYGSSIYDLSNHPEIKKLIHEAIHEKKSLNYETLNTKAKGEVTVWNSSTLTPIFDSNGHLRKIIIIDSDITELKTQEQVILQKNKDITDSISYAKKIQTSILPPETLIKKHLPNSFLTYFTKDIVSGDFYWFTHFNDTSIIAAVDCTGHGVPGAFMSLIGYNLLNKIVNEQKITVPSDILFALNQGVLDALYKKESESKDGMDIAICKINHSKNSIEYSGAMRPLWIIENNELKEVKADKIPIGTQQKDREETISYTTHTFKLNGNTSFYIFTDGYADQFGGPKEKKYSTSKFKNLLLSLQEIPMEDQYQIIKEEHLVWKGKNEQVDDILVIGFKL